MEKKTVPRYSCSQLFASWEDSCIQSAIEELKEGIKIESERLGAREYLITLWHYDWEWDQTYECIELVESFDSLEDACSSVDAVYDEKLKIYIKTDNTEGWILSPMIEPESFGKPPEPLRPTKIKREYYRFFRVETKKKIDASSYYIQVLKTPNGNIVSDELMAFLNCEWELHSYFYRVVENKKKSDNKSRTSLFLSIS